MVSGHLRHVGTHRIRRTCATRTCVALTKLYEAFRTIHGVTKGEGGSSAHEQSYAAGLAHRNATSIDGDKYMRAKLLIRQPSGVDGLGARLDVEH